MTKGKHGRRAANREAATIDLLAPYQRKVVHLTAEVKRLKEEIREKARVHAAELRRLRTERDQGNSPALVVAQREALKMREERDRANLLFADLRRTHDRMCTTFGHHLRREHGLSRTEALEFLVGTVVEDDERVPVVVDESLVHYHSTDDKEAERLRAERILRARGERR